MFARALVEGSGSGRMLPEFASLRRALEARGTPAAVFTEKQMLRRRLDLAGALVAGQIPSMHAAMQQLGVERPEPDDYPDSLRSLLRRRVWRGTVADIEDRLRSARAEPFFAKPAGRLKRFTGRVFESEQDLGAIYGVSRHAECWLSDVVRWRAEHRAFVVGGEVVGIRRYAGEGEVDWGLIEEAVRGYAGAPAGYAIDFGLLESGETSLIERNDGYGIGSYGLADEAYLAVIEARWAELVGWRPAEF